MTEQGGDGPRGKELAGLTFAALGVVYGDIGTSPLYALKECFAIGHGLARTPENVIGVLSLILWSLMFVVTYKYITVMLKADNRGEGGILALLALVRTSGGHPGLRRRLVLLALFGAALLYGDGVITPPVSVLGRARRDRSCHAGPPTVYRARWRWSSSLDCFWSNALGPIELGRASRRSWWCGSRPSLCSASSRSSRNPVVLKAINPWYAVDFFIRDGMVGFLILGSVVLVLTGGEALYADMGHFGPRPIRLAWVGMVLPALMLNYFGQGALLLERPEAAANPFFELVPRWFLYPMIVIATLAAITASQALISGCFSLTRQAVQLGYSPRVTIVHTSHHAQGQIYVPEVNWGLMIMCLALRDRVQEFRQSDRGLRHCGDRHDGHHHRLVRPCGSVSVALADLASGRDGRDVLGRRSGVLLGQHGQVRPRRLVPPRARCRGLRPDGDLEGRPSDRVEVTKSPMTMEEFVESFSKSESYRVPGTGVFMNSDPVGVPPMMLHHLKHNGVLKERVIFLSVRVEDVPTVDPEADRVCTTWAEGSIGSWPATASWSHPTSRRCCLVGPLRARGQSDAGLLLLGAGDPAARPGTGQAGSVAEAALHPDGPERPVGVEFLQSAAQPSGGDGRADPDLGARHSRLGTRLEEIGRSGGGAWRFSG